VTRSHHDAAFFRQGVYSDQAGGTPIASEVRYGRSEDTRRMYYAAGDGGPCLRADSVSSVLDVTSALQPRVLVAAAWARFVQILYATFLPAGFPASLPPEYLRYQSWNVVQDLSSSLRGVLCTQKILEGMGVGNAAMTSLAATLLWMAKDGCSMLGGLAFTAAFSHRSAQARESEAINADTSRCRGGGGGVHT